MSKKILIIDDEAGFTKLLRMNLERNGDYEVMIENHSVHALKTAQDFQPDLVLLDLVMPGLDGGDVAALFQADPKLKKVPVIMLTALVAHGETSTGSVAQAAGVTVLPKPVEMATLRSCITDILKKS